MNSSGECSNCQLVSFASSGVCKRCGTVTKAGNKWLTATLVGVAAFAVIGVTLWAVVFITPKPAAHRSHVVDQQFASLPEQTEWLMDMTSIEDCQSLDRKVANPVPCETPETVSFEDQAMRSICTLKTMKAQDPARWELTLKKLATQPTATVPETVTPIE